MSANAVIPMPTLDHYTFELPFICSSGLVPTSVTLPVTASITAEFAALEFAALDTASETISMDVLGTPRPAREVREPGLTVGLTLALILTLLLVVLVTALSLFIAWRRHKRQRCVDLLCIYS